MVDRDGGLLLSLDAPGEIGEATARIGNAFPDAGVLDSPADRP